jgi:hypothetical protein
MYNLKNSKRYLLICILSFFSGLIIAQPYIDLAQARYTNSPDAGIHSKDKINNNYQYYNINVNLPFIFKKDSSMIVISPFVESWLINIATSTDMGMPDKLQSFAFPVNYIKPLSSHWTATIALMPRWNGYDSHVFDNSSFQMGGYAFAGFKKNDHLEYKFGLYYNSEFSGPFLIPVAGIDWQINKKNTLFGILPIGLTYEHAVTKKFYYGAQFRAITNSYQAGYHENSSLPKYVRIDENQLGLYADIYLAKKIVLTTEFGHSLFRKIRFGEIDSKTRYYNNDKVNDNIYVTATLSYRIRTR